MVRLLSHLLGSYVTHVLHTAWISNDERVLYNDTETLMVRLLSHLIGSYMAHFLHTAWISNDERVLYNDIETLMVRQLSYLLGSYVTHVRTVFKLRILRAARNSLKHQRPHSSRTELTHKHPLNTVIAAHVITILPLSLPSKY